MKMTRRQFSFGVFLGALALLFGKLLGLGKWNKNIEVNDGIEARHWRPGDHLAG